LLFLASLVIVPDQGRVGYGPYQAIVRARVFGEKVVIVTEFKQLLKISYPAFGKNVERNDFDDGCFVKLDKLPFHLPGHLLNL
jgi:hypothetical protein